MLKLTDTESIEVSTIMMQVHFGRNYNTFQDILQRYDERILSRTRQIEYEILEATAGSRDECELLYRKIVNYVLLFSALGDDTGLSVVRETTAALESVLPPVELGTFAALSPKQKRDQLRELTLIVTGIRLFNKSCGKGGASIPALGNELLEKAAELLGYIRMEMKRFSQLASLYAAIIMERDDRPEDVRWLDALMNCRQYGTYLGLLQRDAAMLAGQVGELTRREKERTIALKATVQSRVAVPTGKVYPLFVDLAKAYRQLQEAAAFKDVLTAVLSELQPYTNNQAAFAADNQGLLGSATVPPAVKKVERVLRNESNELTRQGFRQVGVMDTEDGAGEADGGLGEAGALGGEAGAASLGVQPEAVAVAQGRHGGVTLLTPETTHGYDWLALHNGGFCVTSASKAVPVVLPVDRSLGVLQYNGRCYGFAEAPQMAEFLMSMDTIVSNVVDNGKRFPELIELLQLHEYFTTDIQGELQLGPQGSSSAIKNNCAIQTETHPVESNIVKGYESNEWELRRRAIQLANIRQKKTHSTQTDKSNYRRETSTQVYPQKNAVTQTRRDASTSVPKPVTYIRGLRGRRGPKAKKPEVVDLTVGIGGIELEVRGLTGARN